MADRDRPVIRAEHLTTFERDVLRAVFMCELRGERCYNLPPEWKKVREKLRATGHLTNGRGGLPLTKSQWFGRNTIVTRKGRDEACKAD